MSSSIGSAEGPGSTTYYLNVDFDLGLRPRPAQVERPALVRQARELSVQALLGADAADCALLRARVPDELLHYLSVRGLALPRVLAHPRIDPETRFRPFGWSAEAIALNRAHLRPTKHPDVACIRLVNSRSFARELEAELTGQEPDSALVESSTDLARFLAARETSDGWLLKSEFGHAGLANRRIRSPSLSDADRRFVERRLAEDDRLTVEPWRRRQRDWSMIFEVPFRAATLRIHETVYTREGGLIGAWFTPGGPELGPDREELEGATEHVGRKLEEAGYFGPVCVDAFRWHDGRRSRIRPVVDINARQPMTDPAYRLWRRTFADRHVFYRFFARRKLRAPAALAEWGNRLCERDYDPQKRRGILLVSPLSLEIDGEVRRPAKLAAMLVGASCEETRELEDEFRRRFEA